MTCTSRRILAALLVSCWTATGLALTPEQKEKVRQLVKEGGELTQQGQFETARDRLTEALALARVPAIALYTGRAQEASHEPFKAAQMYRMAIEMPLDESLWDGDKSKTEFQRRAREEARTLLKQLLERNPTVKLQLVGRPAEEISVTMDGTVWESELLVYEQPVAPGSHVIAVAVGTKRLSQSLNLDRTDHKTITFDLTPNPDEGLTGARGKSETSPTRDTLASAPPEANATPTPPNPPRTTHNYLTWSMLALGAAGLGTGTVAALITNSKHSTLVSEGCSSDGICPRGGQISASEISSHNAWRTTSIVGFVVGGIGVATAATLWLTRSAEQPPPRVGLFAAPDSIGIRGAF